MKRRLAISVYLLRRRFMAALPLREPPDPTLDGVRRVYAEFAWLGVLQAAVGTYAPVYILRLGGDPFLVGMLTGGSAVSGVLVAVLSSPLFRRVRDPWALMVWSRVVCRLPYIPIVVLPWIQNLPQAPLFVALVLATAIPAQISTVGMNALMPDLVPHSTRSRTLSGWYLRLGLVAAVTTLIAGWVLERLPFPGGYQLLFGVGFVTAIIGISRLNGVRRPKDGWSTTSSRGVADLDPRRWTQAFRRYLAVLVFAQVGYGMGVPLLSIYWVRNLALPDGSIGILASTMAIAQVVSLPMWGRLGDRFSSARVLPVAMLALAIQVFLTAATANEVLLIVAAALGGLGVGGLQFGQYYRLVDLAPPAERLGYALSFTAATSLALAIGPLLATGLTERLGSVVPPLLLAGGLRLSAPLLSLAREAQLKLEAQRT